MPKRQESPSSTEQAEVPDEPAKRPRIESTRAQRVARAAAWLRDGPLPIEGLLDLIAGFTHVLEGRCLQTISTDGFPVCRLTVLPDGRLVSGSFDHTVRVWDAEKGVCLLTLSGHIGQVFSLTVLPAGQLASSSHDKTVRVWDPLSGECKFTLPSHTGLVRTLAVLPGGRLATGSNDMTVRVWE